MSRALLALRRRRARSGSGCRWSVFFLLVARLGEGRGQVVEDGAWLDLGLPYTAQVGLRWT